MSNPIEEKSFAFALDIIKIYKDLSTNAKEFVMSRQLLRAGTSIGANIAEAQQAQSRADFLSKMNIALKEACETRYWLRLLSASDYLNDSSTKQIFLNIDELIRLLAAIVKSTKQNTEK